MNNLTIILFAFLALAIIFFLITVFAFGLDIFPAGDLAKICNDKNNCFTVDMNNFFNSTQRDIIQKSFTNIGKVQNISEADLLECFLNEERQLYCMEIIE